MRSQVASKWGQLFASKEGAYQISVPSLPGSDRDCQQSFRASGRDLAEEPACTRLAMYVRHTNFQQMGTNVNPGIINYSIMIHNRYLQPMRRGTVQSSLCGRGWEQK